MKCRYCDHTMVIADVWDDDLDLGYAYNLFLCNRCGSICKEDVWKGKGQIWIDVTNNVIKVIPC